MRNNTFTVQAVDSSSINPDRTSAKIAFLVYNSMKASHRKDRSFDGMSNIGAKVIEDVLKEVGYDIGRCVPGTASEYDIILVSFTSIFDMLSFYQSVALLPNWQYESRKFKVIAGGFGMQNPMVVRKFVDYAVFGRAHTFVVSLVDKVLCKEHIEHESVMNLPDIHNVSIYQAPLYNEISNVQFKLGTKSIDYSEQFTGCPLKCKFCHYTFARSHVVADGQDKHDYVQMLYQNDNSPELTFDQLFTAKRHMGRPRVAIDGFSERLRYIYGKRILDSEITEGINAIGELGERTVLKVYNISNFPGESEEDRQAFYYAVKEADPKHRVIIDLHSTPFRPSLATPMQWEPVTLFPQWSDLRYTTIYAGERHSKTGVRAYHSKYLDSVYTHLTEAVIIRATKNTDTLFHAVAFAPRLNSGTSIEKYKRVINNFDVSPYIREYELDEDPPAQFLIGTMDVDKLRLIAKKMRQEITDSNWKPKGRSLKQIRLSRLV